jgi:phosphonate transport system substrate-binding protein
MLTALAGFLGRHDCLGQQARRLRPASLRVLHSSTFFSGVNRDDARAAVKVWLQTMARSRGYLLDATVDAFDRVEEADKRIAANSADLITFNAVEYLRSSQTGKLDAMFTADCRDGSSPNDYLVLARRDRNLATLADLRGKSVVFYKWGADWSHVWMDVELNEAGLGPAANFLGATIETDKPSSVVLPVFFGSRDAAVVKRWTFNSMVAMNPQLSSQLQILAHSPELPDFVVCVHKNYTGFRQDLLQVLADLPADPSGHQILLLYNIDNLKPFQARQLDAARDILARHARIKPAAGRQVVVAHSGGPPQ